MFFDSLCVEHIPHTSGLPRPSDVCQIYDSRRAITFREYVEGVVRLARLVHMHSYADSDINVGASTVTAPGFPKNVTAATSHSATPRTPAVARIGTAPTDGHGSLSPLGGPGRGASANSNNGNAPHDGGMAMGAATAVADGGEAPQRRAVQSVNADFKRFVGTHLSALLAKLSVQAASRSGGDRGGGRGGGNNGRGVGARSGEGASRRGVETAGGSKRGEEDAGPVESACVKELSGAEEQVRVQLNLFGRCFSRKSYRLCVFLECIHMFAGAMSWLPYVWLP